VLDSEVSSCLRTDGPSRVAPLALAALVVTAFVAVMGAQSVTEAASASADPSGCSTTNGQLSHHTSDGYFVADAPGCVPEVTGVDHKTAPVADAGRATGSTRGVNPGTDGQCTWGAAQKWFEASGSYPALSGDALSWNDAATAAGWTVVDDAQDRSIVVFEPGVAGAGSVGHVAWVDSVSQRADGRWIHVTEMNNSYLGGVGIFNDRDVMDVSGMSYILLP
jgi:surface antigen